MQRVFGPIRESVLVLISIVYVVFVSMSFVPLFLLLLLLFYKHLLSGPAL